MKNILSALLLTFPPALYGQIATTDPVGYIIHPVAGNALGNPIGADTFLSLALVERKEFSEVIDSVTGASVSFASPIGVPIVPGGMWLEINNGAEEGSWRTVTGVSVDGRSLTLDSPLPALPPGSVVSLRRFSTLGRFLSFSIFDPTDEVYVPTPSGVPAGPYFYTAAGWVDGAANPADAVVLMPGSAVLYRRKGREPLEFVSVGHVKLGKSRIPFRAGDNWLSPMHAVPLRLDQANLDTGNPATGVGRGDGSGAEDYVVQLNLDQTASSFFAADPATGFSGFVDMNGEPAGHALLSESQGFLLRRQPALGDGIWTVPPVFVAPGLAPEPALAGTSKRSLNSRLAVSKSAAKSSAFSTWAKRKFGRSLGAHDDTDADGTPNLIEWSMGRDPMKADAATSSPLSVTLTSDSSGPVLELSLQRSLSVSPGAITVEASGDFTNWRTVATPGVARPAKGSYRATRLRSAGGVEFSAVRVPVGWLQNGDRYFRLRVNGQ